ncbi:MAG TPA: tRNA lysidine(34) synthetase TilS [Acidimicrobiia bacterium]
MVATRRLDALVENALGRISVPPGDLTVAISGGADSAALARLALATGAVVRGLHIDHGLPGSPMLATAARDVATTLDIPLDVVRVEVAAGASPEEQARDARYPVFHSRTGPVLTGHTRDDDTETILINLVRGSGPQGLAGIPPFRPPNVYRPILTLTRSETREMAALAGLPFRDDPMNEDLGLTRNQIRLRVLPLLSELNPQAGNAIARAGRIVGADSMYLDSLVTGYDVSGGLPVSIVVTLPGPLGDRLLALLLETNDIGATSERIGRAREVAIGEATRHDLAGGRTIARSGAMLVVR